MCEKLWDWIDTSGKEIDQRRKDLVLCVRAVKTLNEEFCWVWHKNLLKRVQHVLHDFFSFNQSYQFCSDTRKRSVACSSRSGTCQLQVNSFVPGGNNFIFVRYPQVLNFLKVFFPRFFQRHTKNPRNKMKLLQRKLIRKTSYTRILIINRATNTWKSCGKETRELS